MVELFKLQVDLLSNGNRMKMLMRKILFIVVMLVSPILLAQSRGITLESVVPQVNTPFVNGTYRALVIGNDKYQDTQNRWPELKTAISDARSVENILRTNYGFSDVDVLENATRRDILIGLEKLSRKALPNDSILVYYAGHGFLDTESNRV